MAAAAMLAVGGAMPPLDGHRAPTFERSERPSYDGFGRKKPKVQHPRAGGKRRSRAWQVYATRVVATHSYREDPRADKYLHASARGYRALRRAMRRAA